MSIHWKSYAAGAFAGVLLLSCAKPRREPKPAVQVTAAALTTTSTVSATGDTYVRSGSPNQNQAGEPTIRLQSSGQYRGLLFFDVDALRTAVGSGTLHSARLELTIDSAPTGWGTSGRPIALHRLKKASAEYSATWNCAVDATIYNSVADCSGATAWSMSSTDPNVQPWLSPAIGTTTITNSQTGAVSFDVTADVSAIINNSWPGYGFLLKKVDESASGVVDFVARERGPAARIVLDVDGPGGGSGGGGSGGGGSGPNLQSTPVPPIKDSYVRQGDPNRNFGTSTILRIEASGRNRGIVDFDPAAISAAVGSDGVAAAHLEVTITQTYPNWGPDRVVGVHRLKDSWTELGATWNCGVDADPSNPTDNDCISRWVMWNPQLPAEQISWVDPPTDKTLISSAQTGILRFDVTKDVACGVAGYVPFHGFVIKKEAENQSGRIELASRETATSPVLVVDHAPGAAMQVSAAICAGTLLPDGGVPDAGTPDAGSCTPTGVDDDCDGVDNDCDQKVDEAYAISETQCGQGACLAYGERSCVAGVVTDSCNALGATSPDTNCDGVDNDCDGLTDEAYVAQSTTCGTGACVRSGQRTCVNGATVDSCAPGTSIGDDANCDGIDDNCNGSADENYVAQTTSCGIGVCARTGTTSCVNGSVVNSCTPGAAGADDSACDGIDSDCDGHVDEAYAPVSTTCGLGVCASTGTTSCTNGSVANSCSPGAAGADDTACDGIDSDCDGHVDEAYAPVSTTCGLGVCASTGTTSCTNGSVANSCTPGAAGADDTACDGIDSDCDGHVDESYARVSTTCGLGVCASTGTTSCTNGSVANSCTPGAAGADDSACDGIDSDCDGHVDESYAPVSTTCGLGVCASTGTTSCVNGSVANSCTPGAAGADDTACDGIDSDCDGHVDEAYASWLRAAEWAGARARG